MSVPHEKRLTYSPAFGVGQPPRAWRVLREDNGAEVWLVRSEITDPSRPGDVIYTDNEGRRYTRGSRIGHVVAINPDAEEGR
jgi:hypothetical protein